MQTEAKRYLGYGFGTSARDYRIIIYKYGLNGPNEVFHVVHIYAHTYQQYTREKSHKRKKEKRKPYCHIACAKAARIKRILNF